MNQVITVYLLQVPIVNYVYKVLLIELDYFYLRRSLQGYALFCLCVCWILIWEALAGQLMGS